MTLKGKKCAMLVEEGFEDLELWYPVIRLREEGAEVVLVGSGSATTYRGKYGLSAVPDVTAGEVTADEFAVVLVPGGWTPDKLRRYPAVLEPGGGCLQQGKDYCCHLPRTWVLISAKILPPAYYNLLVPLRMMWKMPGPSMWTQRWVKSGNIITSRTPADLPAYCREIISALREQ